VLDSGDRVLVIALQSRIRQSALLFQIKFDLCRYRRCEEVFAALVARQTSKLGYELRVCLDLGLVVESRVLGVVGLASRDVFLVESHNLDGVGVQAVEVQFCHG